MVPACPRLHPAVRPAPARVPVALRPAVPVAALGQERPLKAPGSPVAALSAPSRASGRGRGLRACTRRCGPAARACPRRAVSSLRARYRAVTRVTLAPRHPCPARNPARGGVTGPLRALALGARTGGCLAPPAVFRALALRRVPARGPALCCAPWPSPCLPRAICCGRAAVARGMRKAPGSMCRGPWDGGPYPARDGSMRRMRAMTSR